MPSKTETKCASTAVAAAELVDDKAALHASRLQLERVHCIRCPCGGEKTAVHRSSWHRHSQSKSHLGTFTRLLSFISQFPAWLDSNPIFIVILHPDMAERLKKIGMALKVDWVNMRVFKVAVVDELARPRHAAAIKKNKVRHRNVDVALGRSLASITIPCEISAVSPVEEEPIVKQPALISEGKQEVAV